MLLSTALFAAMIIRTFREIGSPLGNDCVLSGGDSHPESSKESDRSEKSDALYEAVHERAGEGSFGKTEALTRSLPEISLHVKEDIRERRIISPELFDVLEKMLTPEDWKLLECIWAYNRETLFPHSLRVFCIAFEKFKRQFVSGEAPVHSLSEEIAEESGSDEHVSVREFLRACVLHDIGKLSLTAAVIENAVRDEESVGFVSSLSRSDDPTCRSRARFILSRISPGFDESSEHLEGISEEGIRLLLSKNPRSNRMNKFMPIEELLRIEYRKRQSSSHGGGESVSRTSYPDEEAWMRSHLSRLETLGFSGADSLGTIIDAHEKESGRILAANGASFPALLAEHHHHADRKMGLRVASSMIRFCDELEALRAVREYKQGMTLSRALATIVRESLRDESALFDPGTVALCALDEVGRDVKCESAIDIGSIDKSPIRKDGGNEPVSRVLACWKESVGRREGPIGREAAEEVSSFIESELRRLLLEARQALSCAKDVMRGSLASVPPESGETRVVL